MSRWGHWSLSDLQPWSRSQGRERGRGEQGGPGGHWEPGRGWHSRERKLRLGFLSKTCPVNGGCAGGPGEELAQPRRQSPALSLKEPSWSPNPAPSSYKALPLLSPAKPPSVAMTTGAGKAGAPSALPHPLPSCSLQLGPGLRASHWLQPSPASETLAPSYRAWPQPPPAQKARRRAPTPAPPTPTPAPCPAMVPALPRAGPVSH